MRGSVRDLRGGEIQLGGTQLHDIAQTDVVTRLGEVEREFGLIEQLLGQGHTVSGRGGIQESYPHVAHYAVGEIVNVFSGSFGFQFGFRLAGTIESSVQNRNRDVHAHGAVASGYVI